ncbi:hypothetical protein KEJ32_08025, partial [Candidatus Bathyarchaeota archaeon]|nr:hypothetical protein [Candidatus Bathyarchaeota archaeon]
ATDGSANLWDNDYPFGGNFWSDYEGEDNNYGPLQNILGYSDGLGDARYTKWGITDRYPLMKPYGGSRDIGIKTVTASKTYIPYNYNQTITLNIKIINYGQQTETFNCTAYYDSMLIGELGISLPSRGLKPNSMIVRIPWETTGLTFGNYTVTANITILLGEEDIVDNIYKIWVKVVVPGNVNGDNIVDMSDVGVVLRNYGQSEP